MFFKNLQPYRLPAGWGMTADALAEQLARKQFQPCGNQDAESRGWVSPTGDGFLVHQVGAQWMICLQIESKLLPSAVVKEEAARRAEDIAEQQGYKPGRKQMKDLRELVLQELLPRAFRRTRKTFAWIDPVAGWLCVDAPSQARAEDLLEVLRQSLDTLPLALVRTERSPTSAMADWLAGGEAPAGFTIDQDCRLRSATEERAEVTYTRALNEEQIREHLTSGKLPTKLAMTFDDRVSFTLTEKLEIKRLEFLDVVKEDLDAQGAEDAAALFDAGFALMTGELARLLPSLIDALGGELKASESQ